MVWLYVMFFWVPSFKGERFHTQGDYDEAFPSKCTLLATFHYKHGAYDVGPVIIGARGWGEMIQNVVKLELLYDP